MQSINLKTKIESSSIHTLSLEPSLLLSATYDGEKNLALLKFYNHRDKRIYHWYDNTAHKPYCYAMLDEEEFDKIRNKKGVLNIEKIKKFDALRDREIIVDKIIADNPLVIGGREDSIREEIKNVWEADIKYYENYLYDRQLIPGAYYSIKDDTIIPYSYKVPDQVDLALKSLLWDKIKDSKIFDEERNYIMEWARLLNQPTIDIRRVAMDIEVATEEGRIPDAKRAENEVIAVSFVGDDIKEVYVLNNKNSKGDNKPEDIDIIIVNSEKELLLRVFDRMLDYPMLITFNGDDFDLPYLYHRAKNKGIESNEIPIRLQREGGRHGSATLKHGVHIDLYKTFTNRSLQIYAFSNKYTEHTLNAVSEALINESKIEFDGSINDLPLYELAKYCYNDARLTYKLTTFNDNLLIKLLIIISRVARMPIEDISRMGVSQWIRSMLYFEHRKKNLLIPRKDELDAKSIATTTAIIKDKKYKGGFVVEPRAGVHFNVVVLDFASLYPSIIKVNNLSYETVRCVHEECKINSIPETEHWVCKKRKGLESLLIGSLRDLRVNYYKHISKDNTLHEEERALYKIVSQALKVILNASYGVMGAEIFPLYYLPVAEATASIGRYTITRTIEKCKELGLEVVYGDTDSLFLKGVKKEDIEIISSWVKNEMGVDLDIDKTYRYVVFSGKKKNYFGVMNDGSVDVKGLTGKKSHTPPFIRNAFYDVIDKLGKVTNEKDFEIARNEIMKIIRDDVKRLKERSIPLEELTFNVMISKAPHEYKKTIPQHIRAAQLLEKHREIKAGEIISYIKTITPPGVKPIELAKENEIDVDKYLEAMRSTFDQILAALGYEFDTLLGATKLEDF
ncbi:MAG: DNA-directed DNA polymerase I, partial [Candidatus Nitrosocaldaceae archaeon]